MMEELVNCFVRRLPGIRRMKRCEIGLPHPSIQIALQRHYVTLQGTIFAALDIEADVGKPAIMPQAEIDYMKENMMFRSYDAFAYFRAQLPKGARL